MLFMLLWKLLLWLHSEPLWKSTFYEHSEITVLYLSVWVSHTNAKGKEGLGNRSISTYQNAHIPIIICSSLPMDIGCSVRNECELAHAKYLQSYTLHSQSGQSLWERPSWNQWEDSARGALSLLVLMKWNSRNSANMCTNLAECLFLVASRHTLREKSIRITEHYTHIQM